jgi:hypothetical protein
MSEMTVELMENLLRIARQIAAWDDESWTGLDDLLQEWDDRVNALRGAVASGPEMGLRDAGSPPVNRNEAQPQSASILIARMVELDSEVRRCVEALGRRKKNVERELLAIRQSQRALQAYGGKQ